MFTILLHARLGIGAKMISQKEQISNSVFLNEKLKVTLTGRTNPGSEGFNMNRHAQYLDKHSKSSKKPEKRPSKPLGDDDDGESRSKSIGKGQCTRPFSGYVSKRKR